MTTSKTFFSPGFRPHPHPSTFAAALNGVDRVFLMRPPQLGNPEDLKPFVEAMKHAGGIRLVCFLSLLGVASNPATPHYWIEKNIERAGLPYCHIRPSFFMQNISGIHAFEIKHFDRIVVPAGNSRTSFVDAEDVGYLAAKALSEPEMHQGKAYSVTGPEAIDYRQVEKILSERLGRRIIYADPGLSLATRYWNQIRGLEKAYASIMGILYLMTRLGASKNVTTTFEEVTGKKPQTFRQFVQNNLNAWKQ